MADPIVITKQLAAAQATGIALAQTLGAAGAFNLNGALVSGGVATMDTQRRVAIASVGNDSAITFTVNGTNDAGATIAETVAGTNAGTAVTTQDFRTVSSVTASAATAANVTIGTNGIGSTPWFRPDFHMTSFELAIGMELVSGAATFETEVTDDLVMVPIFLGIGNGGPQAQPTPTPYIWPGLGPAAVNTYGEIDRPIEAWRGVVVAGAGQVRFVGRQAGIRN